MAPTPGRPAMILVLAPPATVDELRQALLGQGVEVCDRATAGGRRPDVVVVGPAAPGPDHVKEAESPAEPGRPGPPVLALVPGGDPDTRRWPRPAGAVDVLPLPLVAGEVAARVALAVRLSEAEAALADRNTRLAAWAHRAGHDLRTPLAVITGMAETLEASWERLGPEDRARMLAAIRNQAARTMQMVDEAVALARGPDEPGGRP